MISALRQRALELMQHCLERKDDPAALRALDADILDAIIALDSTPCAGRRARDERKKCIVELQQLQRCVDSLRQYSVLRQRVLRDQALLLSLV